MGRFAIRWNSTGVQTHASGIGFFGIGECVSECLSVCLSVCVYVCVNVCVYTCMHVCMYVYMLGCMYVCMYDRLVFHGLGWAASSPLAGLRARRRQGCELAVPRLNSGSWGFGFGGVGRGGCFGCWGSLYSPELQRSHDGHRTGRLAATAAD